MLTAYYDLSSSPPTYEVVSFLMRVECERIACDADSVRIVFLPGPVEGFRRDTLWPHGGSAREAMLHNVCVPLCRLLPSVADMQIDKGRSLAVPGGFGIKRRLYGFHEYVAAYRDGVRPLRPRGPAAFVREPDLITITLREAKHWPQRNSNVDAWLEAAAELQRQGFRVVFVRDTEKADEALVGFQNSPQASRDLEKRACLYARAALNLFVSNGPAWMCMAMDLPAIIFKPINNRLGLAFSRHHLAACGVPAGGQMPGSPLHQRLVWQDDTAETIVAAVGDHLRLLPEAA